jgi:hypothetical protein
MKRTIIGLVVVEVWFAAHTAAAMQAPTDPVSEESGTGTIAHQDNGNKSRSMTDRFLAGMRSPIGFSLGMYELYTPNFSDSRLGDKSPVFTMLKPRLFANVKTKRTQFQFDYAFGYKRYNRRSEIHSSDHSAKLDFDYRLSRNASLQISDTFRSAFNDYGALPTSTAPTLYQPSFAQDLYMPNERTSTNSLVTGMNLRPGKRTNVTVFGSYDMWRYSASSSDNAQGFQIGIRGDHQINKWLFLNSGYSHYLNKVNPRFEVASIHRLQVGGLKFKPRRTVEIYFSGGVDATRFQGSQRGAASFQAGLSRTSAASSISAIYYRGFSNAVGPQATLKGDLVSASVSQWFSRRVNLQVNSGYTRGASLNRNSKLEYISGNAQVQIAVQSHMTFDVQGSYVSQRGVNLPSESPVLSRYTISAGFQIFFSSLDGRRSSGR